MKFTEWMETVPCFIRDDAVWRVEAYRLALFAGELAWQDASKLAGDKRTSGIADQLFRSAGAISGDICEGYSRRSGKDQARFYEYGLGSAREARDWYYKSRNVLGEQVFSHRMELLTQIIKGLLTIIPTERGFRLRDEISEYCAYTPNLLDAPPMPHAIASAHAPRTTHHATLS